MTFENLWDLTVAAIKESSHLIGIEPTSVIYTRPDLTGIGDNIVAVFCQPDKIEFKGENRQYDFRTAALMVFIAQKATLDNGLNAGRESIKPFKIADRLVDVLLDYKELKPARLREALIEPADFRDGYFWVVLSFKCSYDKEVS